MISRLERSREREREKTERDSDQESTSRHVLTCSGINKHACTCTVHVNGSLFAHTAVYDTTHLRLKSNGVRAE